MISLAFSDYGAMITYLVVVVLIGLWFSRGEKDSEEYLLGGRKLPWMAVGISIVMSLLSTYSLVMGPGEVFNHGLSMWILALLTPIFAVFAFMIFVRFYFKLNSFTPFEYLEYRFDAKVRMLIASIYAYTRIFYLGMVLFATSKVFEGGAGWPAWLTIITVGVIGVIYTVMGGMKAVVWTDVMQFFVLVAGVVAAVVVLCNNIDGGFFGAISYAFANGRGLDRFSETSFYTMSPYVRLSFWLLLLGYVMGPLGTASADQITIQRLLSTSSYKNAFKAQVTSSCLIIPFQLIIWFIGLAIFTYYAQNPDSRVTTGDTAFFLFISTRLPSPLPGLFLAAMLAAAMSTLDSGINSLSAIWLKEFHQKLINPNLDGLAQVRISRISSAWVGIFSIAMALLLTISSKWFEQTFVEVATIFGALAVITLPAFLFAVFSKRVNSTFIWLMAFFLWGMKMGMITWYAVSKRCDVVWEKGEPLGFGGPISPLWILVPLLLGLIILAIGEVAKKRWMLFPAMMPIGMTGAIGLWVLASNYLISETPQVLSFQWVGFPITVSFILFGIIGLRYCPVQPLKKYKGLTWATLNEDVEK
jgi:SSS family transporter